MRILLITDGIWPYVLGGMQKHSYYLCKYFARNKVDVHLVHFNQSAFDIQKLEFFSDDEKKYISQTIIPFPKPGIFPGHYLRNSFEYSKTVFNNIGEKLDTFDFIYAKGFTAWYFIEQKRKGKIMPPIGVKFHGYEMFQKAPDFKIKLQHLFLLRKPVKYISRNADIVFSYGGKITDIIKAIGVTPTKIIEMPSGVEQDALQQDIKQPGNRIKFVFLGRYERRKGIEEINAALEINANPGFEFHFIGPIPQDKKLHLPQVSYHGEIRDKQQLNRLLREFDILVCPSWSEGMPNVILEAMAQGLAVIATDVGATNVLVDNSTGWLIRDSDAIHLARLFAEISQCSKNEIAEKKQNALRKISSGFVWEKLIASLISNIQSHLTNQPSRR